MTVDKFCCAGWRLGRRHCVFLQWWWVVQWSRMGSLSTKIHGTLHTSRLIYIRAKVKTTSLPTCCIDSNLCVYTTATAARTTIKEKIAFAFAFALVQMHPLIMLFSTSVSPQPKILPKILMKNGLQLVIYRMEFNKTRCPAHRIVTKTVHKTPPGHFLSV